MERKRACPSLWCFSCSFRCVEKKKKYICPASLSFCLPLILLGLWEKGFHEQAVCHSGCVHQCTECSWWSGLLWWEDKEVSLSSRCLCLSRYVGTTVPTSVTSHSNKHTHTLAYTAKIIFLISPFFVLFSKHPCVSILNLRQIYLKV